MDIVPFDNSNGRVKPKANKPVDNSNKDKGRTTVRKKPKKFGVGEAERDAFAKGYKLKTPKKSIPTVRAPKGPIKVRPKESDQPKKKMTFGEKFNY